MTTHTTGPVPDPHHNPHEREDGHVLPFRARPTDALPADAVPTTPPMTDAVPTDAVPTDVAPTDVAPGDAVPGDAVRDAAGAATMDSTEEFPTVRGALDTTTGPGTAVEPAPEVVDAELMSEQDEAALASQAERVRRVTHTALARATGLVRTHRTRRPGQPGSGERAREIGLALVRHGHQIGRGHKVWTRQALDAVTHKAIREQIEHARTHRDPGALAVWQDRLRTAHDRRRQGRREFLATLGHVALMGAAGLVGLAVVLVGLGVAVQVTGVAGWSWDSYWRYLAWVGQVGLTVLVLAAALTPVWWLWAAHHAGRVGAPPAWAMSPAQRADAAGEPITPSIVVKAMRDLGISELRKKIAAMPDAGASMLSLIRPAGCGVEVDVMLPNGATTTAEVQRRRRRLAENLNRHEHELHISIPTAVRTVRLWIADSGALDEPIGPSPLVAEPEWSADYYTGAAPWGQDLRGDTLLLRLKQCMLLLTGASNQGKTAALRALALWLTHDPSVEFRIADLKGIGDWHMFTDLATVLIQGPTDPHAVLATHMLEWAVGEMERRIAALDPNRYPDGVTRELARTPGSGFHPIVLIVDEAQIAYMNPAKDDAGNPYGGKSNKSRYFMAVRKIHNQGRALNVVLWEGTQDPNDQNLPKLSREGNHIRGSLYVGTEEQSRMGLGDKAVDGGAAPHKLRLGIDKGTFVITGEGVPLPPGQAAVTVRTHFIDGATATDLASAAKALRGGARLQQEAEEPGPRDLLADTVAVLGEEDMVKATDVAARLRTLAPGHPDYANLTRVELVKRLDQVGVPVRDLNGVATVRVRLVRAALALRDAEVGDQ